MAGGYLTTHVLDTARGQPAAGLAVDLWRLENGTRQMLAQARTNADGRTVAPLIAPGKLAVGQYELVFHAGDYLRAQGHGDGVLFLDEIPIRFGLADGDAHYHVPLLLSPYGYSTYRGS
ncbi:MAG: hydroxyisourate hydrolase [Paracoccaceae bacterium]